MAKIEFHRKGRVSLVETDPRETLLDCALRMNLDPPYSCLEGICSTCAATLRAGRVNVAPEPDGRILTCQAKAVGEETLVVDYDG